MIFGFVVKQGGFFISLPNHYPSDIASKKISVSRISYNPYSLVSEKYGEDLLYPQKPLFDNDERG